MVVGREGALGREGLPPLPPPPRTLPPPPLLPPERVVVRVRAGVAGRAGALLPLPPPERTLPPLLPPPERVGFGFHPVERVPVERVELDDLPPPERDEVDLLPPERTVFLGLLVTRVMSTPLFEGPLLIACLGTLVTRTSSTQAGHLGMVRGPMRVAAAVAMLLLTPTALAAAPAFPVSYKTTTLKNGLTVVRAPLKSRGMVAYFTAVRVGSRNEVEPGLTGFAHFFEHMMFKGTKAWPSPAREALLGKLGYSENAWTSDDLTVYHLVGPASGLEQLVEVEADRLRNLQYSEATFQTEAHAVLGEYLKNAANPLRKLNEVLRASAFRTHTYRHTTIGFYEDIQAMNTRYAYSLDFFKRWYTPDNTFLIVAGDFDDAKLLAAVGKHYGSWKGKAAKVSVPPEPPQVEVRTALLEWKTTTLPRHGLYWHTPSSVKATATQLVLGEYLAGRVSPLYKALVLEKQLVDSVGAAYSPRRDPYLFGLTAALRDEAKRPEVDHAMLQAVAELASGKVDDKRVQAVQDNITYSTLLELETPEAVADTLAVHAAIFGSPAAAAQVHDAVRALKPKDLVAFAKEHLSERTRTAAVLTVPERTPAPAPEKGASR